MWVLYLRLGQSVTHIVSTSVPAVQLRAALFFGQMLIYAWWAIQLLALSQRSRLLAPTPSSSA